MHVCILCIIYKHIHMYNTLHDICIGIKCVSY